ncbi:MAG: hypothetical protein OEZ22_05380 [Spirochaetia bacterium]|nr:hypothetical protein [Spirochaetia bacterium]
MENEKKLYEKDKLKIEIETASYLIRIRWLGECTLKNPAEFLDPILTDQLNLSLQKPMKKIILDFQKFSFMNSSAIIPIIKILKSARDGKGTIQVLYNKNIQWQEVLLGELKLFETPDKKVQIRGL